MSNEKNADQTRNERQRWQRTRKTRDAEFQVDMAGLDHLIILARSSAQARLFAETHCQLHKGAVSAKFISVLSDADAERIRGLDPDATPYVMLMNQLSARYSMPGVLRYLTSQGHRQIKVPTSWRRT